MASVVLSLFLVSLANVVLSQDSSPSPALAAPSSMTATESAHATHTVTVGKVFVLLMCKKEMLIVLPFVAAQPVRP